MKKKILILGVCTLLVCGCGKTIPKLDNGSEAVVTFENGSMISINELYDNLKSNYALNTLVTMVDQKILEDKYKDSLDSANEYANQTMKSLEDNYKDDLLEAIQTYTSFQSIDAYRNYVYINHLQSMAIEDYAKEKVTDKEIKNYYDKNTYGDMLIDHILVTSKVESTASDDDKKKAEEEAKNTINTIISKLKESKNVKETFTELAREYSEDTSTKEDGGSLGYINEGTLSSAYDEILKNAIKLKDGEFSTEVITTELGYHVILREASKEKASLDDLKDSIRSKIADTKLTEDATLSVKALQELRKSYGMEIVDSDIQSQYANSIQNALAQAQASASSKN